MSYKFFCNTKCEYYPCHKTDGELNCLFCFCPLYYNDYCPGNPNLFETTDGKKIKDCSSCGYPHKLENYEQIIRILREE